MAETTENIDEDTPKDVQPMYGEDNQIAAYMVDFAEKDESLGYAIVNKDGQVVEYSYGEGNFIEEMEEKVCNKKQKGKLYYIEPLDYYIEIKDAGKNELYYNAATAKKVKDIEWYCKTRKPKISCTAKLVEGTNNGEKVVAELKKRRPCILRVKKHNTYKNHTLLALGYETFTSKKGNSTKKNIYIRVNDGWTQQSNRYVWGGCYGSWDYTSVNISTK